ncbi:hypothetical protein YC2023_053059 [Brassica napus]
MCLPLLVASQSSLKPSLQKRKSRIKDRVFVFCERPLHLAVASRCDAVFDDGFPERVHHVASITRSSQRFVPSCVRDTATTTPRSLELASEPAEFPSCVPISLRRGSSHFTANHHELLLPRLDQAVTAPPSPPSRDQASSVQAVLSGARVSSSSSFAVVGISFTVVRVETKLSISSNGDFFIIFKTGPWPFDSLQNGPSLWNVQKCPRESNPKFPMCDLAQANITNLQPWSLAPGQKVDLCAVDTCPLLFKNLKMLACVFKMGFHQTF